MRKLKLPVILVLLILTIFPEVSCSRFSGKASVRKAERQMSGPKRANRKMKELPAVRRAKKSTEKRQARVDKDYENFIKQSKKRTYEIQSENVKARMKQNEANIAAREKEKDKRIKAQSKGRAKKFR